MSSSSPLHSAQILGDKQWEGHFLRKTEEQFKWPKIIIHNRILTRLGLLVFHKTFFIVVSSGEPKERWFTNDLTVKDPFASRDQKCLSLEPVTFSLTMILNKIWKSSISSSFKNLLKEMDREEVPWSQWSTTEPLRHCGIWSSFGNLVFRGILSTQNLAKTHFHV